MAEPANFRVIRDPLWNTIRLDPIAMAIVDTPAFQRLRYIRQLGHTHLVYPGATHTRFGHALGVYHLSVTAVRLLRERTELTDEVWAEADLIPYAALLHDIGHYAFSHALEELEEERTPGHHEEVSAHFFQSEELRSALVTDVADLEATGEPFRRGEGAQQARQLRVRVSVFDEQLDLGHAGLAATEDDAHDQAEDQWAGQHDDDAQG